MFNQAGRNSVVLSTFGGLVTEAPAAALTEGSSPLCWDVDFLVGAVFTRGGLSSVYGTGVNSKNFVWFKTYQQSSTGQIYTLALASDGTLWRENVSSNPGVLTQVQSVMAGDGAFSTTAFNREYFGFNQHDIPRQYGQYDGVNFDFDRVSQEGPAAPPLVNVTSTANPNQAAITAYAIASNVATLTAVNAFTTGEIVQIQLPGTILNGVVLTVATASGTQFTATFVYSGTITTTNVGGTATPLTQFPITSITQNASHTISNSTGGQLLWSAAPGSTNTGNTVTVYYAYKSSGGDTALINAFTAGLSVYVYMTFNVPNFINGTYQVVSIGTGIPPGDSNVHFYFTFAAPSSAYYLSNVNNAATYQMSMATVTLTTPMPGISVGTQVALTSTTPSAWSNTWSVIQTPNSGVFSVTQTQVNASGVCTYSYTLLSGNAPVVGDLVTVIGTTGDNGILNCVNAPITAIGTGTFSVSGFTPVANGPNVESATASTSGRIFLIDPGSQYVGIPNATSPIYGNDTSTGYAVLTNTTLNIASGTRQAVVLFLTRNGLLTKPSPPITFTTNIGTSSVNMSQIPLGPPNVIARWIAFTEAGANGVPGAYFYVIPIPVNTIVNGQPYTYQATVINDNITTTASFTFIDSVLLSSLEIDIPGGNNFNQVELGSAQWCVNYANRMFWGLEDNKITNLLNMSFNGGYIPQLQPIGTAGSLAYAPDAYPKPLGWTFDATFGGGGCLVNSSVFGHAYYINNNTGSTQSTFYGLITQPAYQDAYKNPIIQPNTTYSIRVAARIPSGNTSGQLYINLALFNANSGTYQGLGGSVAGFTVNFSQMSATTQVFTGTFLLVGFKTVPSNLVLQMSAYNIANGADVEIDRIEIFPTAQPVLNTQLRASYVNNPEAFDGITGNLVVNQTNQQSLYGGFVMYDQLYLLKESSLFQTEDSASTEPANWKVNEVSNKVGTCGIYAYDVGEEWCVTACRSGVWAFFGKQPIKISQEIFQLWEAINWQYGSSIWLRVDIVNRRILIGVPMATGPGTASYPWLPNAPTVSNPTSPNVVLMLNYLGLGDITALADGPQLHTTMFGTLMSVDMRRKWTVWNITSPIANFIMRQDGYTRSLFLGNGVNNGKIYQFLASQLSDDGAAINSTYTTYGFVDHTKAQQNPLLGLHRKAFNYLQALIYGSGNVSFTYLMNSLMPPQSGYKTTPSPITLAAVPTDDYERPINQVGNRIYVQISSNAVGAAWTLERLILVGAQAALSVRGNAAQ